MDVSLSADAQAFLIEAKRNADYCANNPVACVEDAPIALRANPVTQRDKDRAAAAHELITHGLVVDTARPGVRPLIRLTEAGHIYAENLMRAQGD